MKDSLKQFYKEQSSTKSVQLSSDAKQRVKANVMMNLGKVIDEPHPKTSFWSGFLLKSYVLTPIIILLFVSGATLVSANSIPGDVLYPVKRKAEDVRIFITPTESRKSELKTEFAKKRLHEFDELKKRGSAKKENFEQVEPRQQNFEDNKNERRDRAKKRAEEDAKNAIETLKHTRETIEQNHEERVKEIEETLKEYEDEHLEIQREREDDEEDSRKEEDREERNREDDSSGHNSED